MERSRDKASLSHGEAARIASSADSCSPRRPTRPSNVRATEIGQARFSHCSSESHAWVEYWTGSWRPIDPTSGAPVRERHVVVARGRDYSDIPPHKGIYHGAPASALAVTVEVTRLA